MNILILDPGLSKRQGHNAAIAEELSLELAGLPRAQLTVAGSHALAPQDFAGLAGRYLPVFRLDGYVHYTAADTADEQRWRQLLALLVQQLQDLQLSQYDLILMPTAYPAYLQALAALAGTLGKARLLCGLLLPARFWAKDDEAGRRLAAAMSQGVVALHASGRALFYTETGRFASNQGSVPTPILLPPVSERNLAAMARLAQSFCPSRDGLSVGYFGAPFTSKGFSLLTSAIEQGLPRGVRVVVRLPPGHEKICAALQARSPQVDATSRTSSNAEFLQDMAAVDVVWTLYDPHHYADKMSGIVPEAICLGKPLLVGQGCNALIEFLDHHAPGSFVCAGYDAASVRGAFSLPAPAWRELARCAAASAPVMRSIKSAARYLTIAGAGALYDQPPVAKAA